MSGKVWMSSVLSNSNVGFKLGLRRKPYDQDWDPVGHAPPPVGHTVIQSLNRYTSGHLLLREEFPEAAAVWEEKSFKKAKDIFAVGGFYCVKGLLADVFSRFDLGEGGLIPFPIYKANLETPYPGEFFLLNFGCRKDTILPEMSDKVVKFSVVKATGKQRWKIQDWETEPVALSSEALKGPDLWMEEALYNKIFMSDALGQAIIDLGMKDVFRLEECRIVEVGQ